MTVLDKPIRDINAEDIRQLCQDRRPEGPQFEIKRDLPTKDGKPADYSNVGDYARNALATEIVAFANTFGGTMVIGVIESSDKPNRATAIAPMPNCDDLARIVDPPLPMLESWGVVTEEDGTSGVVVMRVVKSRRAPHRSMATKEVYVRRDDESVRIDMREVQELTMRRLAEVHAIDEEIARRREAFRQDFKEFAYDNACGLHYIAVPTTSIELGRVVNRPELYAKETFVEVLIGDQLVQETTWRFGEFYNWRPALRAVNALETRENLETRFSLNSGGLCELTFFVGKPEHAPFYAAWFASSMGLMLNWLDRVRSGGGFADQEYAVAPMLLVRGQASLRPFGQGIFSDPSELPAGVHVFPIYPVNARDDFDKIIARFNEDFWNIAGVAPSGELSFHLRR